MAAVLLLSLLALPVFPQCNLTPQYSGQYRTSVLDVAVDDSDLWLATSYGVQVLNAGASKPVSIGTLALPGITRAVRASHAIAYAASGTSIAIVRRNTSNLQLIRIVDLGATVNDLLVTTNYLYAATANGIAQFDLLDPLNPTRTSATFPTSAQNVTSLALNGSTLLAADGDLTVEQFNISVPNLPQPSGTIEALPRSISVKVADSRIYVSDGLQTAVIIGSTRAATLPFGATSLAGASNAMVFVAGTDRRLRAFDLSSASQPVELYATELVPSGGTINRFSQLVLASGRLYGAAGDAGLISVDLAATNMPRSYPFGAMTSLSMIDTRVITSRSGGGLSDFTTSASGNLTAARQWDTRVSIVQDSDTGFLLTSSGKTLTFWTLQSTTPVEVSNATFTQNVDSAVLIGTKAYALLADHTFWSADLTAVNAPVAQITIDATPSMLTRFGSSILLAEVREEGSTRLLYYRTPAFTVPTLTATVEGLPTARIAMNNAFAAVFTFRGISLVSLSSGSVNVLPGTNAVIAQQLAFSDGPLGSFLLETTDNSLIVRSLTTSQLRTFALPSSPIAMRAQGSIVTLATNDGVTSLNLAVPGESPKATALTNGNAYYRKAVAGGDRLYLFDGRGVDAFSVASGAAPHFVAAVRPNGVIDVAASNSRLFTLASNGTVGAWSPDGVQLAQATLDEGTDVQPLAIATVNGAVWVSIAKGCLTSACEKKTIVLDPSSLVRTTTLAGAATDATVSGNRAYALFDLPSEIRVLDVSDALHPTVVASRPTEGTPAPVSIAVATNTVLVLGEKLYLYDDALSTKTGEPLPSFTADPSGAVAYVDQRVRVDGSCVLISGRAFSPSVLTFPSFATSQTIAVPAAVKSVATAGGRTYLLTNYSLEVLGGTAPTAPGRRRAAK